MAAGCSALWGRGVPGAVPGDRHGLRRPGTGSEVRVRGGARGRPVAHPGPVRWSRQRAHRGRRRSGDPGEWAGTARAGALDLPGTERRASGGGRPVRRGCRWRREVRGRGLRCGPPVDHRPGAFLQYVAGRLGFRHRHLAGSGLGRGGIRGGIYRILQFSDRQPRAELQRRRKRCLRGEVQPIWKRIGVLHLCGRIGRRPGVRNRGGWERICLCDGFNQLGKFPGAQCAAVPARGRAERVRLEVESRRKQPGL